MCAGKSGVLQPWVPAALGALEQVAQLDIAEAFREPVPRGVPYYHDIVKKPMDLGTIALQLERGMYQTLPELQADMQLVWDNCAAFNEPESDIAGAGRHLADLWRRVGSSDALMAAANAAAPAAEAVQPRPPMPAQQPGGHGPPAGIAGAPLQPGWGGMSTMSRATVRPPPFVFAHPLFSQQSTARHLRIAMGACMDPAAGRPPALSLWHCDALLASHSRSAFRMGEHHKAMA